MNRPGLPPLIMGILNVTPDSFSDGGRYADTSAAIDHGLRMIGQGADILDIGGESTRPGASRVTAVDQIARVVPVIEGLVNRAGSKLTISIDTTLAEVADAALQAGATFINDVSAGREDPDMFRLASVRRCAIVLMHMHGTPATMQDNPVYENVVEDVLKFLLERVSAARDTGIDESQIFIDPGIGFGKTLEHNLALLQHLHRFVQTGYPVLLGASRKRFLKAICQEDSNQYLAGATSATTVLGVQAGVSIFRVHDVRENRQAADVAYRMQLRTSPEHSHGH